MERPNTIDDLMRQRLRGAEVPPPAFVWPNVEQALRKRKRRFLIWLFFGGFAVASLAVGLWWAYQGRPEPAINQPVADTTPPVSRPLASPIPKQATGAKSTDWVEPEIKLPAANAGTASMPGTTKTPKGGGLVKAGGHVRETAVFEQAGPLPQNSNADNTAEQKAPVGQPGPHIVASELAPTTADASNVNEQAADPATAPFGMVALALNPPSLLALPARPNPLMHPVLLPPAKAKRTTKKCYDFHANPKAWLLDAYVGPSWATKHLTTTDTEQQDYLAERERTERRDFGLNAGLRASYLFGGNFLLRTGLNLDHFEEQFEHIDPNYIQYDIRITQKFINGQWVSVTDTLGILYGTNYLKTYNRFTMLDIPLQVALELRSGATGVSLNLGGSVNLLFEKRGSILHPDGFPVSFSPGSGQQEVFRSSLGISLLGSIQWFYHVGPRTRVFAEPYYRHILDPVTRPELQYEQSYGIAGLRLGLTRIFN
ncbi:MAG: hypothetical protein ACKVU2_13620 [Saprospiraceae bacterium]